MAVKQVKAVKGDEEAEASEPDEVDADVVEGDVPEGAEVEIEDPAEEQALTVKKVSGTEMVISQGVTKPATQEEMEAIGAVILSGDWGKVKTLRDRVLLYKKYCDELGVSPWNSPFALGNLGDGKKKLFQQKGFGEERREQRQISVRIVDQHADADLGIYFVHVIGMTPDGRVDEEIGVDAIGKGINLKGNDLGTAMMTALTRAKNRLSNSMCGSGTKEIERLKELTNSEKLERQEANGLYRAMADRPIAYKQIVGEMRVEVPRAAATAGQATIVPSAPKAGAGVPATAQPGTGVPRAGAVRAGVPRAGQQASQPAPVTASAVIEEPVGVQAQPPSEEAAEGQAKKEDVDLPVPPAMATSSPAKPAAPRVVPRAGAGAGTGAGVKAQGQVLPPMRTPGRGVPPKQ